MTDDTGLDAWITQRINAAIPRDKTWVPREVAEKLIATLEESEPDRLADWMRVNAVRLLKQTIDIRHRSDRARLLRQTRRAVFNDAVEAFGDDEGSLDPYLIPYKIDERTGETGYLGDMTGSDCGQAAEPYERRTAENALQAKFLRALERRLKPRQKVKSVYTREQLAAMFDSLGLEME